MADKEEKKDFEKKQEEKTPMSLIDTTMIREKTTIGFSACIAAVLILMEIYVMIRMPEQLLLMGFLLIPFAIDVYVMVNAIINLSLLNKKSEKEKYDELYRAQTASYLIVKKSFEELEDRLNDLEDASAIPSDNLINAQKALAKVQLNRNKENTLAMIDSNEKLLEQIEEMQKNLKAMSTEHSERQEKLFDKTTEELKKEIDMLERKLERLQDTVRTPVSYIMPSQFQKEYKGSEESVDGHKSRLDEAPDIDIDSELEAEEPKTAAEDISVENEPEKDQLELNDKKDVDEESSAEIDAESGDLLDLDNVQSDFEAAPIDIEPSLADTDSEIHETEQEINNPVREEDEIGPEEEPAEESALEPEQAVAEESAPEIEQAVAEESGPEPEQALAEESAPEIEQAPAEEPASMPSPAEESSSVAAADTESAAEGAIKAQENAPKEESIGGLDMSDPNKVLSPEEIEKLFANI